MAHMSTCRGVNVAINIIGIPMQVFYSSAVCGGSSSSRTHAGRRTTATSTARTAERRK